MDAKTGIALVGGACLGAALTWALHETARPPRGQGSRDAQKREQSGIQNTTARGNANIHLTTLETSHVAPENVLEDEVLAEQFTRNIQFFGPQAQAAVSTSFVIVVGLGVSKMML
jgi:hypothetical protein